MRLSKASQYGVGLIEVLVALLLLAIAVLGYSALQMTAIKLTNESAKRTTANLIMQQLGQTVRANPSAIHVFSNQINQRSSASVAKPNQLCGFELSSSGTSNLCTAQQLAAAEAYVITKKTQQTGLTIQMIPCPTNQRQGVYCAIIAWQNTLAIVGEGLNACVNHKGVYHPNTTCLIAELS
ncbi:type IV pilus modification protein PilV [Psychrobacter sp. HD31]|uniref:type IV pilus modification protein PilV n=1 Tax=Psychrobacter sp. HD31 TaxID=3112003 RepID=UPI003DA3615C